MATTTTRPLTPEVREKLGKLLPLLSSSRVGGASAAAAIDRTLKAAGSISTTYPGRSLRQPQRRHHHHHRGAQHPRTMSGTRLSLVGQIVELVETTALAAQIYRAAEEFLDSLLDRAERYDVVFVSLKMRHWIVDLMRQAGLDCHA